LDDYGSSVARTATFHPLWTRPGEGPGTGAMGGGGCGILREPRREPWGLLEMWIADPDGVRICLVEVPEEHPLRRRG